MKLISIGSDRKIFEENSAVRERQVKYGNLFKQLHLVIFSLKKHKLKVSRLSENVWAYPTNSNSKISYIWDAFKISKKLIRGDLTTNSVVTTQDPFEAGLVGYWLSKRFKLPLQIQIHTDFLSPYFQHSNWLNKLRVLIARRTLPQAKSIRVVSERVKYSLINKLKIESQKINVLPITLGSGANKSAKVAAKSFPFTLLIASRLTEEKNIPIALKALKQIISQYPHVGLTIVGEGPERGNYEELIGKWDLDKSVKFIGWQNDLGPYYRSADAFVLTSLYEGFGMTLVEAANNNCPIVTTDVGLVGSVLNDGREALVCSVGDGNCLAEKIILLIEDPELRTRLASQAKAVIDKWVLSEEAYLEAYKLGLEKLAR